MNATNYHEPMFVSVTRLRVRSFRFVPLFLLYTARTLRQVKRARGFQTGAVLADRHRTYWTLTGWDGPESMRAYMISGSHKSAMRHLLHWCDEASVAHWTQPDYELPSWTEADKLMRELGRPSKVLNPSPQHAILGYERPRTTLGQTIRPLKTAGPGS